MATNAISLARSHARRGWFQRVYWSVNVKVRRDRQIRYAIVLVVGIITMYAICDIIVSFVR